MLHLGESGQWTLVLPFWDHSHRCSLVAITIYSIWVTEIFLFSWIIQSVSPSIIAPPTWHYIDVINLSWIMLRLLSAEIICVSTYSQWLSWNIGWKVVCHHFLHATVLHPLRFSRIVSSVSESLLIGLILIRFKIIFFSIPRSHGCLRWCFTRSLMRQNCSCGIRSTSQIEMVTSFMIWHHD